VAITGDGDGATSGPTAKGALSADEAINQALLVNDTDALETLLADDWVVVSGFGGIAEKSGFIDFIRKGGPRKTMTLSEARVRLYGDTALVTTHLRASGPFVAEVNGKLVRKCFDVKERQTDVLVWKNRAWKSVLLHETVIPPGPKLGCT
jgi:ketosteroid isomerase-like protein